MIPSTLKKNWTLHNDNDFDNDFDNDNNDIILLTTSQYLLIFKSAEMTLKTVKYASCRYLDNLPTKGSYDKNEGCLQNYNNYLH